MSHDEEDVTAQAASSRVIELLVREKEFQHNHHRP